MKKLPTSTRGASYKLRKKGGIVNTAIIAPSSRAKQFSRSEIWSEIEQVERRKDSRLAREFQVTLPCRLSDAENWGILINFGQFLATRFGTIADVAMHQHSRKDGDKRNIHGHVLMATRRHDGEKFTTKIRVLDNPRRFRHIIFALRKKFAEITNQALEKECLDERVDHRSFAARGLDKIPKRRLTLQLYAVQERLKKDCLASERELADALNSSVFKIPTDSKDMPESLNSLMIDCSQAYSELNDIVSFWEGLLREPLRLSQLTVKPDGALSLPANLKKTHG